MRPQKIVAAVAAAALTLGSVGSFAQSYNGKEQDEQRAREQIARGQGQPPPGADGRRDSRWNGNNAPAANSRNNYRGDNRVDNRRDYRNDNRPDYRGANRGDYRDGHSWHRGDRLPVEYRSRQYVVDDWRGHHLSAPPRGYHWVQAGGDYVLVAVATGIIASILLNQ
jgi:Ni/Co efflux regulator RcnB